MALSAGTVAVADDESSSGSGWAKALYDADATTFAATLPDPNAPPAGFTVESWAPIARSIRLAALRERARQANAYAAANVSHVTGNAVVNPGTLAAKIVAGTSLGRTPNPNTPDTSLQGLTIDVEVPVVHSGTVS